ncbi:phage tail tape measure protein [Vibrio parahaemolyticus]|uniref:phage tail tape measure protein n=1 Tax=Vibrio parahaemolyticus TaxID=670 RepID=UPI003891A76A
MAKNATIANINISMDADAAKLMQKVKEAEKGFTVTMNKMLKQVKRFNQNMGGMAASTASALTKVGGTATVTTAAITGLAVAAYNNQREMQRMADIAGVSVSQMQALRHAATGINTDLDTLSDAMKDLSVRIQDAANGGGALVDFFTVTGESAKEWAKLDPASQMDRFQQALNRMDSSQARFWADEVNDSMYRVHVGLERTGKSLNDFTQDALNLGAGTSGGLTYMVNEMYNSFSRLRIIIGEIAGTSLALLAKAFTKVFDELTQHLQSTVSNTGSVGEGIFNLSKQIVTSIVKAIDAAVTHVKRFVMEVTKLLGKFDSSFLKGMADEPLYQLSLVDDKIDETQEKIDKLLNSSKRGDGSVVGERLEKELKRLQKIMQGLQTQKDELVATTSNTLFSDVLETIENLEYSEIKVNIKPILSNTEGLKGGSSAVAVDLPMMQEGLAVIKEINKVNGLNADSTLRTLELQMKQVEAVKAYYKTLLANADATKAASLTKGIDEANKALESLQAAHNERSKQLATEAANEEEQHRKDEINRERSFLASKLALAQNYFASSRDLADLEYQQKAMDSAQFLAEERERLRLQYEAGQITKTEQYAKDLEAKRAHEERLEWLTQERVMNEIALEANKWALGLEGMQGFFGESKTLAKASLAVTKGVALAETMMNQYKAVSSAWADPSLPWYAKAGAAALAVGQVGSAIKGIQAINGQFHNGGEIPRDGTYYMEGGEMVIPKDKVTDFVNNAGRVEGEGGGVVVNSTINMGANLVDEKVMAAALQKQQSTIAALVQREQRKRPTRR